MKIFQRKQLVLFRYNLKIMKLNGILGGLFKKSQVKKFKISVFKEDQIISKVEKLKNIEDKARFRLFIFIR